MCYGCRGCGKCGKKNTVAGFSLDGNRTCPSCKAVVDDDALKKCPECGASLPPALRPPGGSKKS